VHHFKQKIIFLPPQKLSESALVSQELFSSQYHLKLKFYVIKDSKIMNKKNFSFSLNF